MGYNTAIIADQLLNQALVKLQYRLGMLDSNNPLDNSLQTEYRVKINGEEFTVYEPTALRLKMQQPSQVELLSIEGHKTVQDYTTKSELPSHLKH